MIRINNALTELINYIYFEVMLLMYTLIYAGADLKTVEGEITPF